MPVTETSPTPRAAERPCPNGCGPLAPIFFHGATLDRCPTCAGLFLDADEIPILHDTPADALRRLDDSLIPAGHKAAARARKPADLRPCPACRSLMLPAVVPARVTVTLDRCPVCGGIWADDHELEAVTQIPVTDPTVHISAKLPVDARDELLRDLAAEIANHDHLIARQAEKATVFQSLATWIHGQG